jgi:hypothetical protein
MGWSSHPILAKGVARATPDFLLLLLLFNIFLLEKKKINGQNEVVLG